MSRKISIASWKSPGVCLFVYGEEIGTYTPTDEQRIEWFRMGKDEYKEKIPKERCHFSPRELFKKGGSK